MKVAQRFIAGFVGKDWSVPAGTIEMIATTFERDLGGANDTLSSLAGRVAFKTLSQH